MADPAPFRIRLLRDPAFHFLLIGLALFLIHRGARGEPGNGGPAAIAVEGEAVDRLRDDFRERAGRPPDPGEDSLLLAEAARDEILFREALAMGLGEGDEIVRRRLILKMEFFLDDIPGLDPPSDAELEAIRATDPRRYSVPPTAAFSHLFFNASRHGPRAGEHAAGILARMRSGALTESAAAALADPFIVETPPSAAAETEIAAAFGEEFARRIFALDTGSWQGPVPSAYGRHLVLIRERRDGRELTVAESRPKLAADWSAARKARARADFLAGMARKYALEIRRDGKGASGTP